MRLFIALNFNDSTRSGLLALRDRLRAGARRGNYSHDANLHLTLAFLGECDEVQTAAVKSIMDALHFEPPEVTIERVGRFRRDGGDIWWAGVRKTRPLLDLQGAITELLNAAGFTLDRRDYNPHITLGREVATTAPPWEITPFGETVNCVDLMKSERVGGKLTYTAIYKKYAG